MVNSSVREWDRIIESLDPPILLLLIESRMSAALLRQVTPEDIWQEALMHAWRDRAGLEWRGLRAFRSWLLTIIDNRIRDAADRATAHKRGAGRQPVLFTDLGASDARTADGASSPDVPASTTPSRIAMQREQAAAIRMALEALSDDVRDVVRLRLIEQLSIEEIAQRLTIGESAVRHRFRRGAELYAVQLRRALGTQLSTAVKTDALSRHPNSAPPGEPRSSATQ